MWRRVSFHQDNVIKHGPEWTRMVSVESLDAPRQSHPSASAYTRTERCFLCPAIVCAWHFLISWTKEYYGTRGTQWMRLQHKARSDPNLFHISTRPAECLAEVKGAREYDQVTKNANSICFVPYHLPI